MEQFSHLTKSDFVSKKARPPLENQRDLVDVVYALRQVLCVKG